MKRLPLLASLLALLLSAAAHASSIADVAKAQLVLNAVIALASQFQTASGPLTPPTPIAGTTGKFVLPVNAVGEPTEWAQKSLNAEIGALIGEKAGEQAGKAVASHVPMGGLLSMAAKKKGKELGAITAIGGMDYIRRTSSLSFDSLDDYAVYLHATQANREAVAAAIAVYPKLEDAFQPAVKRAYQAAAKAAKATTVVAKN